MSGAWVVARDALREGEGALTDLEAQLRGALALAARASGELGEMEEAAVLAAREATTSALEEGSARVRRVERELAVVDARLQRAEEECEQLRREKALRASLPGGGGGMWGRGGDGGGGEASDAVGGGGGGGGEANDTVELMRAVASLSEECDELRRVNELLSDECDGLKRVNKRLAEECEAMRGAQEKGEVMRTAQEGEVMRSEEGGGAKTTSSGGGQLEETRVLREGLLDLQMALQQREGELQRMIEGRGAEGEAAAVLGEVEVMLSSLEGKLQPRPSGSNWLAKLWSSVGARRPRVQQGGRVEALLALDLQAEARREEGVLEKLEEEGCEAVTNARASQRAVRLCVESLAAGEAHARAVCGETSRAFQLQLSEAERELAELRQFE